MQAFFDWYREQAFAPEVNWLIFGKGPSFARRHAFDLAAFRTVALNHSIRELGVDLAHAIDLDVVRDCGADIEKNSRALVMPWVPHIENFAGRRCLAELLEEVPVLGRLSGQGRLLWYNFASTPIVNGTSAIVPAGWFSAEAVLNLLAMAGARHVRSLGVDGGVTYSPEFDDLKDKTLLANKHESFDRQFGKIAETILYTGVDYAPLDVESPVRVYVGCSEEEMLAVRVLEFSIRRHASMTVEVHPLHLARVPIPMPRDPRNRPRTPFSFHRFLIPALAGHRGRAIYLDADMLLFDDIRRLWTKPLDGAQILAAAKPDDSQRRPQFSVMLLDCATLGWDIGRIVEALDRGDLTYETLMFEMAVAQRIRADLSPDWNSLERYDEATTALLHYTDMNTQPWVSRDNPLGHLWMRALFQAIDTRFISLDYLHEHISRGWVRPSLMFQLANRIEDSRQLPMQACAMDDFFVPPYKRLPHVAAAAKPPEPARESLFHRVKRTLQGAAGRGS
jgi:hypothetical protein